MDTPWLPSTSKVSTAETPDGHLLFFGQQLFRARHFLYYTNFFIVTSCSSASALRSSSSENIAVVNQVHCSRPPPAACLQLWWPRVSFDPAYQVFYDPSENSFSSFCTSTALKALPSTRLAPKQPQAAASITLRALQPPTSLASSQKGQTLVSSFQR